MVQRNAISLTYSYLIFLRERTLRVAGPEDRQLLGCFIGVNSETKHLWRHQLGRGDGRRYGLNDGGSFALCSDGRRRQRTFEWLHHLRIMGNFNLHLSTLTSRQMNDPLFSYTWLVRVSARGVPVTVEPLATGVRTRLVCPRSWQGSDCRTEALGCRGLETTEWTEWLVDIWVWSCGATTAKVWGAEEIVPLNIFFLASSTCQWRRKPFNSDWTYQKTNCYKVQVNKKL